jgi:hypothetical protein
MAVAPARPWTMDQDDRLCAMVAQRLARGVIADALGVSRNAVTGRIDRLRAAGDPRIPPAGPSAASTLVDVSALAPIDALAELLAEGCPTVPAAAKRLGVSISTAQRMWRRICDRLGAQVA